MCGLKVVYALRHHVGNRRWHSGEILGRSRSVLKKSLKLSEQNGSFSAPITDVCKFHLQLFRMKMAMIQLS